MIDRFSLCPSSVVTLRTISGDAGMIKCTSCPRHCGVARIALGGRWNMGSAFTACVDTVMATRTDACHLGVVDTHNRPPKRSRMARLAHFRRRNMGSTFSGGAASVVALYAIIGNSIVTKRCRRPSHCAMAHLTFLRRCDMKSVFTTSTDAIVAGRAGAHYLRMVDS